MNAITCDTLKYDHLSITSNIDKTLIPCKPKPFKQQFSKREKRLYRKLKKSDKFRNLKTLYKYVFCIVLSSKRKIYAILCLKPNGKIDNEGHPVAFSRLEFNPDRLRENDYHRLLNRLHTLFGASLARTLINIAIVTRYDVAVDIAGYTTNSFEFHALNKQTSDIVGSAEKGLTKYAGNHQGSGECSFYRVYDKILELIYRGQLYISPDEDILRVEFCNKERIPLHRLADQKYPLESLKCYIPFFDDEYFDRKFVSRCKRRGLSYALHTIKNSRKRRRYKRHLERYEISLLDHELHSSQLTDLARKLLNNLRCA